MKKTYDQILNETINKYLKEETTQEQLLANAGNAVMSGARTAGNWMLANKGKTAAIATGGAFALWRMKKARCRQNCTKIQDPVQRDSCIKQC